MIFWKILNCFGEFTILVRYRAFFLIFSALYAPYFFYRMVRELQNRSQNDRLNRANILVYNFIVLGDISEIVIFP